MTKEQKEAIERLEIHKEYAGLSNGVVFVNKKDLETALKMLKEKDKETKTLLWTIRGLRGLSNLLDIKDKIINLIAEQLAGLTIWDNEKEEPLILTDKEEVKQYFERKATNNG